MKAFLSYLWGMETFTDTWCICVWILAFYPTYEEWKLGEKCLLAFSFKLFILPMRNGNSFLPQSSKYFLSLFILPMRNGNWSISCLPFPIMYSFLSYLWGMETPSGQTYFLLHLLPFYPTYEEWKQINQNIYIYHYFPFYPTYQEWKQNIPKAPLFVFSFFFYPTYEEWKLNVHNVSSATLLGSFFFFF